MKLEDLNVWQILTEKEFQGYVSYDYPFKRELTGFSFVVLNEIGPWKQVIRDYIPNAKFLYQAEYDSMQELTKYTNFPFFTTNITIPSESYDTDDCVTIPITDDSATMTFYVAYLKSQQNMIAPLTKKLVSVWPKD